MKNYDDTDRIQANSVTSIGNWMLTLLIAFIPVVNLIALIFYIIWSKKPSKRNWAVANVTWMLIIDIIGIIVSIVGVITLSHIFAPNIDCLMKYCINTPVTVLNFEDALDAFLHGFPKAIEAVPEVAEEVIGMIG